MKSTTVISLLLLLFSMSCFASKNKVFFDAGFDAQGYYYRSVMQQGKHNGDEIFCEYSQNKGKPNQFIKWTGENRVKEFNEDDLPCEYESKVVQLKKLMQSSTGRKALAKAGRKDRERVSKVLMEQANKK